VCGYEEKENIMTTWDKLKTFINSKNVGDVIHRKDIIHYIYNGPMPRKYLGSYGSTVDNYRKLLTKLGILEHTGRGEYKLRYYIREDLKTTHLQMLVINGITL